MDAAPHPSNTPVASLALRDLWRYPWMRHALTLWVILAIASAVKCYVQPWEHSVYPNFYKATIRWWNDDSIYTLTGYQYTPTFAIANSPFAWCGISAGAALFNAASIAALVAAVFVLARDVLPGRWTLAGAALLLTLTFAGALRGVWASQSNALVIALVIFAASAILRQRWWTASFLLAAPVFVKLWPMALVMLVLACWPSKLWWRFPLACLALAAVPFLTRWPETVLFQHQQYWIALTHLQTIRSGGYRDAWTILEQFVEPSRRAYLLLQLGGALAVLGFCLWRRWRAPSPRHAMTAVLSAWIVWQLLLGPGSERMTYGIIAPLAGWAVVVSFQQGRGRLLSFTAWSFTSVLGTGAVERILAPYVGGVEAIQPIGVVLFAAWLLANELRGARQVEQPATETPPVEQPLPATRMAA
ncbi:MAG: glycosyltransferase family 87 protein [Pirellulaceae bacterium]